MWSATDFQPPDGDPMTLTPSRVPPPTVTIREKAPRDARAVERLAGRDSKRPPTGRALVAELGGELVAAVPISGGEPLADPFRHTAAAVSLLELRAAQLRGDEPSGGRLAAIRGRIRIRRRPRLGSVAGRPGAA
jgi:hypothetical protein